MQATRDTVKEIKKVCVIGPECTGKTDLAQFLAKHFETPCVEEYARAYLNKLGRKYDQVDLLKIAHGQLRMEDEDVDPVQQMRLANVLCWFASYM